MMASSDSDILPSKRQRTQNPKGKEKMGHAMAEEEEGICGICLSSGSLAVRGQIESCDHQFCFICIMEWAKVESRCPMCKQRFYSISRPEVPGLFSATRVVEVPVRDQADHLEGNGSSTPFDPYAQANCIVCHGSQDEELLLLCDICDSASHTYCAGHGYTVPEGDWYCNDCNILREEHAKIDSDVNDVQQNYQKKSLGGFTSEQPVSIFDIVADETSFAIEFSAQQDLHERAVSRNSTNENSNSQSRILTAVELESFSVSELVTESSVPVRHVQQGARTMHHCRNLHRRIQALRQNWNSLRSGSMSFSSTLVYNGDTGFGRNQTTTYDISQQPKSSSLVRAEQMTQSNIVSTIRANNVPLDEDKAWKMMEKAKILQGSKTQSLPLANSSSSSCRFTHSLKSSGSTTISKGDGSYSSTPFTSKNQGAANKMVGCSTLEIPLGKAVYEGCKPQGFRAQFPPTQTLNQAKNVRRVYVNACSKNRLNSASLKNEQALPQEVAGYIKEISPSQLTFLYNHESPCSSLSTATSEAGRKSQGVPCHKDLPHEMKKASDDAKSEVQSLVKLNLKLLSKGQCLGTAKFKEIARASTHSILAACGLEHSKSSARSFPKPDCSHASCQTLQLHSSSIMPGFVNFKELRITITLTATRFQVTCQRG